MSQENDDDIPNATETWRDYWREMQDSYAVYRWAVTELVAPEAWPHIKRMVMFLVLMTVLQAIQPWTTMYVVDGLVERNVTAIVAGLAAFAVCLAGKVVFNRLWSDEREVVLGENMGRIDLRTSQLFFEKSLGQHLHDGDLLSASNVERGRSSVLSVQGLILFEGLNMVGGLLLSYACLWFISAKVALLVTALFCVHIGWMFFLNGNINRVMVPLEKKFRAMNRRRVDLWQYIERLKANGMEEEALAGLRREFRSLIVPDRAFWLWVIAKMMWRGMGNYLVLMLVTIYGVWMVWNGQWQVGTLFPLLTWTGFIVENLWRVSHIERELNWNAPSVRSMMKALTMQPAVVDGMEELPVDQDGVHIQFENVHCAYPDQSGGSASVLAGVSFEIAPRSKVALIGPSGAGKTTLMRLLFRARDPSCGRVLLNGVDIRQIKLSSWLKHVGYIAQQPQVFDGTVRDNLLFGAAPNKWADPELWALMRTLCVDFGSRLTKGLETRVGKSGLRLSGGQAQRLMIGAAVARGPQFMVVDEATSSLDSTTEREVQRGLKESLGGSVGALIVTHRLSTVRDMCDTFVVLRPSADVKPGEDQVEAIAHSFEELYKISPTFRQLADDQGLVINKMHEVNRV